MLASIEANAFQPSQHIKNQHIISKHIDGAQNKLDNQSEKWSSLSKKINSVLDNDNIDQQQNFQNDLSNVHKALLDELVISNQLVKEKTLFFNYYFKGINNCLSFDEYKVQPQADYEAVKIFANKTNQKNIIQSQVYEQYLVNADLIDRLIQWNNVHRNMLLSNYSRLLKKREGKLSYFLTIYLTCL